MFACLISHSTVIKDVRCVSRIFYNLSFPYKRERAVHMPIVKRVFFATKEFFEWGNAPIHFSKKLRKINLEALRKRLIQEIYVISDFHRVHFNIKFS